MSGQISSYIPLIVVLFVFVVDRTYGGTDATSNSIIRAAGIEKSENEVQARLALLEKTVCGVGDASDDEEENANPSEYPWIALLVYLKDDERRPECGGSLIHERYVLTAAHCINLRTSKRLVSVRLGGYDTASTENCMGRGVSRKCDPPVQEIDVEEAIYHKDYMSTNLSDDVGLVRLARNAVIASNVKPICLPITRASQQFDANRMLISGWALYANRQNDSNDANLQNSLVQLKPLEYCQDLFRTVKLTQNQFCAIGDICKGDSGGPLFKPSQDGLRYIQYGIFAVGVVRSCGPNNTAVYNKLETYLPWIASNINLT